MRFRHIFTFGIIILIAFWQFTVVAGDFNPAVVELLIDQPVSNWTMEHTSKAARIYGAVQMTETPEGVMYYTGKLHYVKPLSFAWGTYGTDPDHIIINEQVARDQLSPLAIEDQTVWVEGKEYHIAGIVEGNHGVYIPVESHEDIPGENSHRLQFVFRNPDLSTRQNVAKPIAVLNQHGIEVHDYYRFGELAGLPLRAIMLVYTLYILGAIYHKFSLVKIWKNRRQLLKPAGLWLLGLGVWAGGMWLLVDFNGFTDTQIRWVSLDQYGQWFFDLYRYKFMTGFTGFDGVLFTTTTVAVLASMLVIGIMVKTKPKPPVLTQGVGTSGLQTETSQPDQPTSGEVLLTLVDEEIA